MNEEALFLEALDKQPHERSAYLDSVCGHDAELRRRLETLLAAHANPGSFLREPALASAGSAHAETTQALDSGAEPRTDAAKTHAEPGASDSSDLAFLTPSKQQNSLGRLEHYEVLEVVGKGGFGIVLKAFDEKLHRIVAIKVLSMELAANGVARQRFIREARTAAAVAHEHVVTIHAVVEEHRPPYLVMQMIDGVTLQQKLDKTGALSLREILRIGLQMAQALDAAHKQGLVHRDIKPANILLENGVERVKITDFGLARAVDDASVTQSGTVAGTPMYMSPEQAEGLAVDHRSDLFSLGTVLYAMCTGHPPFRATGTMAVLKRVIEDTPRPIREVNSEIPDWLCDIIAKLHTKKPEDRFQTAREVAELLGQRLADVQAGRVIEGRAETRKGPVEEATPAPGLWTRNRRIAAFFIVVLGIVFFATSALASNLPAGKINPPGVQWLIALLGIGTIVAGVVLTLDSMRSRLVGALGILALYGIALAFLELGDATHFFHTRQYWINLGVDDPNITIKIVPVAEGDEDPLETIKTHKGWGEPLLISHFQGEKRIRLAAGDYWFAASLDDGAIVHYERVTVDRSRVVVIPWAAEVAKRNKQKHPAPAETGWVQLFNGKDLTRWKTHPEQPGNWNVQDGNLVGSSKSSYLFSENDNFKDFHLRAEVKVNNGGDSGIFFRAPFAMRRGKLADQRRPAAGYEVEIQQAPGHTAFTGSIWDAETAPAAPKLMQRVADASLTKADEWFTLEIIARGNHFITKINGKLVADCHDPRSRYAAGHLALQVFTSQTTVHFKTIEIKELPSEEPGWVQLFNGKDLTGWDTHLPDTWKVENGAIVGKAVGYLFSSKTFRSFHCRIETKINAQGVGGISFRNAAGNSSRVSLGKLPGGGQTGSISQFVGNKHDVATSWKDDLIKPDTWFSVDLVVRGNNVVVRVDDVETARTTLANLPGFGVIGLHSYHAQSVIHFKKIEIKELPTDEPGWVQLFNGQDLTDWTNAKKVFDPWKVESGVLIGTGDNAFLRSERGPIADFHLRMEAKYVGGTAALLFREQSLTAAGAGYVCAMENNKDGDLNTGAVSLMPTKNSPGTFAVPKQALTQDDKWFTLEIIAKGNRLQTLVDGKEAATFIDADDHFKKGFIALIVRGKEGELHVKKIEVRELLPVKEGAELKGKKEAQAQEAAVQFFKLFTAKNMDALMNAADVPFCREGGGNIQKRDDLKRFLEKALSVRDPSKDTIAVKLVTTLAKFEESEGKFSDNERKACLEALGPDHRVVRVEWNRDGDGKHRMLMLIRFEKGEAKIVGIL